MVDAGTRLDVISALGPVDPDRPALARHVSEEPAA
jgi:hypothetical protein